MLYNFHMEEINVLKNYFNKLKRTILFDLDFKFIDMGIIKKNKIDDILCCILATMPPLYKRMLKMKEGRDFHSVLSYNLLMKAIKRKFVFNSNMYLVEVGTANKMLGAIIKNIESDINRMEKLYGSSN